MSKRFLFHRNALAVAAVSLALAACGGSNHNSSAPDVPADPPVVDAFFANVLTRVASLLDTAEPVPIDDVTITTPETTEPEVVPATPT